MMKFKRRFNFKKGWPALLAFFIYDTFLFLGVIGLDFVIYHWESCKSGFDFIDNINIGAFTFSSFEIVSIIYLFLVLYMIFELFHSIWSLLFDWSFKYWEKIE